MTPLPLPPSTHTTWFICICVWIWYHRTCSKCFKNIGQTVDFASSQKTWHTIDIFDLLDSSREPPCASYLRRAVQLCAGLQHSVWLSSSAWPSTPCLFSVTLPWGLPCWSTKASGIKSTGSGRTGVSTHELWRTHWACLKKLSTRLDPIGWATWETLVHPFWQVSLQRHSWRFNTACC